ncbi:hypothetical protein SARC_08418 [Sphaeroforma arctica JP610]|uniref:Uncharacterized protein n=1 Tax=Sphaeroforma arctica JP610 TaxID=667725 RepID=A0A0L0FT90_9EUKA|nr:hypothetical protein SARC_08418 [Sphaeroforma arctica JP610]KNC79183.1 hypothetical protein SARC_08418 [Sphaeroforma arctica JP610]|eukprot:XP_014153085.1 hypothetical protein SARC_08418 [Sphaeroforma arctica JP610]
MKFRFTPVLIPGLVDFITTVKASGGAFGSLATERLGVGSVRSRLTIPPLIAAGERLELSVKPIYINFMETEHPSYDWINEGWPFGIVGHQRILVDSIPELFRMNIQIKNEGVVDCNPGQFSNGLWLPRRNQSSALSLITGKYVWISDGCLRSHQVLNETTFGLQDTFPATELGRCLKTRATRLAVFGDSISV